MKQKRKKILSVLLILSGFCNISSPVTAKAEKHYILDDEPLCSLVYDGGINRFDGKLAETREEIDDLEREVLASGDYVLANQSGHELTDTAFEDLLKSCHDEDGLKVFWFENYLNPKNTFHDTYSKVYLYKPALERYMQALENDTLNDNPFISMELDYSTVVISYEIQFFHDRIGADLSYEVNDGIPEWYATGYLRVESPANVEITLFLTEEQNYYTFYVPKDEPFYIKLKQGGYNVVQVNTKATGDGEETLPFHDLIQITPDNESKENALEFEKTNKIKGIYKDEVFSKNITVTDSYEKALETTGIIFLMTSSKFIKNTLEDMAKFYNKKIPVIIGTKGIDNENKKYNSILVNKILKTKNIAVIAGPSFAIDILNDAILALTVATRKRKIFKKMQNIFKDTRTVLKREMVYAIPYNTLLAEAAQDGGVPELMIRFRTLKENEGDNFLLISQLKELNEGVIQKYHELRAGIK